MSRKKQTTTLVSYDLTNQNLNISGSDILVTLESSTLNALTEGAYYHEIWQVNALGDPQTLMSEKINISSKLIKE